MTEHLHLRVRTDDGTYAIVTPTDGEDFDLVVEGPVRGAEVTEAQEEVALALLHRVACKIREQTWARLVVLRERQRLRAERSPP